MAHTIPLPQEAVTILENLPRMLHNPHVFPSPTERGEPMRDVKRQWKRIRQDVNVELWTKANADRATELRRQAGNDAAFRTMVLDEMLKTGAKPFDVRLHDYRRTLGSWAALSGESLAIIGAVLNHADPSTTAIYARLNQDAKRNAITKQAERLMSVVNGSRRATDF